MSTQVKVQIQQRIDTAANWASANPTPLSGEICWNSDDKKYKIGDGSTAWASLSYAPGSGGYTAGTGVAISASNVITASSIALTTVQTAANQTAHLALTTQEGDVVVRSDEKKTYMRNSGSASDMSDFTLLETPTDAVTSVAGQTGVVTTAQLKSELLLDEDDFATDSDAKGATQQSIKAYVSNLGGGATGGASDKHFLEMDQVITTSYQLTANKNAMSVSPSLNSGVTVTVPSGATWVVI